MTPVEARGRDGLGHLIYRTFIATTLPVVGLFFLRLILASLPVIKRAGPVGDLGVAPLVLIKAAIDTVIYMLLIRFCLSVAGLVRTWRPHLAEVANLVVLAGCAVVATLAYTGYENLAAALIPAQADLYNWSFLALVLAPVVGMIAIVARKMDYFSELMSGSRPAAPPSSAFAYAGPSFAPASPTPFSPSVPASHTPEPLRQADPAARHIVAPTPVSQPPQPPPPAGENAALQQRLAAVGHSVSDARQALNRIRSRGPVGPAVAESAGRMQQYLEGAQHSFASGDAAAAQGFADWAEYEASVVLSAE